MSDKPKLPKYDPDNPDAFDEKAWLKAYIAQLDIETLKEEWSQIDKEKWVPFETVLAELERMNEEQRRKEQ